VSRIEQKAEGCLRLHRSTGVLGLLLRVALVRIVIAARTVSTIHLHLKRDAIAFALLFVIVCSPAGLCSLDIGVRGDCR
jgi:hypothetical protein